MTKCVLLMGCGSVGGVIAGGLLRADHDLTIVTHNEAISQAVNRDGLRVITPDGEAVVPATAHTHLEAVGGTLDIHRLYLPPERRGAGFGLDLLSKHVIMLVVGLKFRRLRSSMLQSLERGRRPEVDFMNGYAVERGREEGVPTPVNAALTALVREIEAGTRQIRPDNLEELMLAPYVQRGNDQALEGRIAISSSRAVRRPSP